MSCVLVTEVENEEFQKNPVLKYRFIHIHLNNSTVAHAAFPVTHNNQHTKDLLNS